MTRLLLHDKYDFATLKDFQELVGLQQILYFRTKGEPSNFNSATVDKATENKFKSLVNRKISLRQPNCVYSGSKRKQKTKQWSGALFTGGRITSITLLS